MAFRSLGSKAGTILLGACGCSFLALPARGQSDKPAEPAPSQQTAPNNPAAAGPVAEVSTHDATSTFKVRVNLVLVRVVARDAFAREDFVGHGFSEESGAHCAHHTRCSDAASSGRCGR